MPNLGVKFTGDSSHLDSTFNHVRHSISEMRREVSGEIGRGLQGFAMQAAGVYGFEEALRHTVETAKELVTTSKRLDLTIEQLQVLRQVAKDNNVEFQNLAGAFERIDVARSKALGNGKDSAKFLAAFASLGVSRQDLTSKTAADLFTGSMSAAAKNMNAEVLASPLREVFGRGFGEILPVLRSNFAEVTDTMKKSGAIMQAEVAAKLTALANEAELVGQIVTAKLAPALLLAAENIYKFALWAGGKIAGAAAWWGAGTALNMDDGPASLSDPANAAHAAAIRRAGNAGASWGSAGDPNKAMQEAEEPFKKAAEDFDEMLKQAAAATKARQKPNFAIEENKDAPAKKLGKLANDLTANQRVGAFAYAFNTQIDLARQQLQTQQGIKAGIDALVSKPGGIPGYGGN